jgi:Programmed cell death protein 2, C-terminal putative domain
VIVVVIARFLYRPLLLPKHLQPDENDQEEGDDDDDDRPGHRDILARFIPVCVHCGENRSFVAQLLPTLLHSLQVDQTTGSLDVQFIKGAMDFGNIMLYTCTPCTSDATVFCVVQKPVDEVPTQQRTFKLVNRPDETGSLWPNEADDQGSMFTDGCVDDDYTIDGEDGDDELW